MWRKSTIPSERLIRCLLAGAALSIVVAAGCASQQRPSSTAAASHPMIVRLVSRQEVITITAGPDAPLYTVADTAGHVLVSGETMHDLKTSKPDLYERLAPAAAPTAEAWAGE